jgi:sarcosine oxidase, subunit beta
MSWSSGEPSIRYTADLPRGADVVIVGGGIVGAATAFFASRAGLRPVVVERRPALCTLTTAAAAGGFRLQQDNEEELGLVRESVELFLNFVDVTRQTVYDPRVSQQGYLWVTTSDAGVERQQRLVALQRAWGLDDVELLSGEEAVQAFPFLSPEVRQARFRRGDGLIDPKALTLGLAAGSGAKIAVDAGVIGLKARAGAIQVETTRGSVWADAAVIAAGPFSGVVSGMAGVTLPVTAVRRQKLVLPEIPAVPPEAPMTIDDDTGPHWRPMFHGAAIMFPDPSTPPSPPADDVPVDPSFAFQVLDPASPAAVARVSPFWRQVWEQGAATWMLQAGQYTMTPDRRPLIGPTGVDGLHVNTGYCGHGVMESPAGSRHLVDVLTGKVARDDNPFRPDRAFEAPSQMDLL